MTNLRVRLGTVSASSLSELVMAWARDSATGEPRYILELDKTRRGSKCGCECASCGAALTAVNAAKEEFEVRPHFRHPAGAQRDDCLVLAARAALLRQFENGGWLELPRRRVSSSVVGLSGATYEAWVELPPEKLHISKVRYRDRTQAVITFDDGRELLVLLTGMSTANAAALTVPAVPTIVLDVDDPSLASMDPSELRNRLRLLPNAVCWRSHWDDADLLAQAELRATDKARFQLDVIPSDLELPPDLPPELKRESVLHYEVKRILSEERRIRVPGVRAEVSVPAADGTDIELYWSEPADVLSLSHIDLEKRFERLIPDVTCKAWPETGGRVFWPLFIEVAVTNLVDEQRLTKIREQAEAALEIDFSRMGGQVNRDQLKRLVVEEISIKRWLHNPKLEEERTRLLDEAQARASKVASALQAHSQAIADRRQATLAAPLEALAEEYVAAAIALHDAFADTESDMNQTPHQRAAELVAKERMADLADKMTLRGYPEASNADLLDDKGILARVLSCKLNRPVGYRLANVMGVLNALWQTQGSRRSFHSLTFIALAVYKPSLTSTQAARVEGWAEAMRRSIRDEAETYRRDPGYDRLLSLLFPEMAAALAKPGGKRQVTGDEAFASASRRAYFLEHQPRTDQAKGRLLDTPPGQWWLKGRDLQAWQATQETWIAAQYDLRRTIA